VDHQKGRYARLRYTAAGALAALAAVGAIAGAAALASQPRAKRHGHAAVATGSATKTPTPPMPGQARTPHPGSDQPFLTAVQRLVNDGTISATEGQAVDRELRTGTVDTQTLASNGFTASQLQGVNQTLASTKRALAPGATGANSAPKEPPPAGTAAPRGGKQPAPAGTGAPRGEKQPPPAASGNSTPK
jgi:hypothetical protein